MTGWYAERTPGKSAKAVLAVTVLAVLLVVAVPVATLAAVVMMLLGHVVGGLALIGGSVLAAAIAIALAGMTGMRHPTTISCPDWLASWPLLSAETPAVPADQGTYRIPVLPRAPSLLLSRPSVGFSHLPKTSAASIQVRLGPPFSVP